MTDPRGAGLGAVHRTLKAGKPKPYPAVPGTLGDHLKRRRLELGLLQREVAEQLGVSESTLRHWEKYTTTPAIRFVPRILEFLGYDPYPEPIDLSQRLFWARRRRGRSIREVARELGIDPGTLQRWERGLRIPRGKWLELVERLVDPRWAGIAP
jgi:transcriptional regulator with XRE-family HTH domain